MGDWGEGVCVMAIYVLILLNKKNTENLHNKGQQRIFNYKLKNKL